MLCTEQRDQRERLLLTLILRHYCWLIFVIYYLGISYSQLARSVNSSEQRVVESAFGVFVELLLVHVRSLHWQGPTHHKGVQRSCYHVGDLQPGQ
jgi:hypothetical protein